VPVFFLLAMSIPFGRMFGREGRFFFPFSLCGGRPGLISLLFPFPMGEAEDKERRSFFFWLSFLVCSFTHS